MGLFSKFFKRRPQTREMEFPEGTSAREVCEAAFAAVRDGEVGTCATVFVKGDPKLWVQLMDHTLNGHYPHAGDPKEEFPKLCEDPLVAGLESYQANVFMTLSLNEMRANQVASWMTRYLAEVLKVNLETTALALKVELI